jgi:hypothetical protein
VEAGRREQYTISGFQKEKYFFRKGLDSGIKKQPVGQITCGKTQAKPQRNDTRSPEKPNGARERALN